MSELPPNFFEYLKEVNNGQLPDYLPSEISAAAVAAGDLSAQNIPEAPGAESAALADAGIAGGGFAGTPEVTAEGDWICPQCRNTNFRRRHECNRCQYPRPPGVVGPSPRDSGKGKGKRNRRDEPLPHNSLNLYITGLPPEMDQSWLRAIFGKHGTVFSTKVLPMKSGKSTCSGFVRMTEEDGKKVVEEVNGTCPDGLPHTITVTAVLEKGGGKGAELGLDVEKAPQTIMMGDPSELVELMQEESDILYLRGPAPRTGMTTELLQKCFGKYCKINNAKMLPGEGGDTFHSLLFIGSVAEASCLITALDGQVLNNFTVPLTIKYARETKPIYERLSETRAGGKHLHHGQIHKIIADEGHGVIYCEDVFKVGGKKVHVDKSTMTKSRMVVGDTVLFFVDWSDREQPTAIEPLMRIGADCPGAAIEYALKGWFRGIANHQKGFGFIDSPELKALFGKDTYVQKDLAGNVSVGYVRFNARLHKNPGDGVLQAMVTHISNCEETWMPSTAGTLDLNIECKVPSIANGQMALGGATGSAAPADFPELAAAHPPPTAQDAAAVAAAAAAAANHPAATAEYAAAAAQYAAVAAAAAVAASASSAPPMINPLASPQMMASAAAMNALAMPGAMPGAGQTAAGDDSDASGDEQNMSMGMASMMGMFGGGMFPMKGKAKGKDAKNGFGCMKGAAKGKDGMMKGLGDMGGSKDKPWLLDKGKGKGPADDLQPRFNDKGKGKLDKGKGKFDKGKAKEDGDDSRGSGTKREHDDPTRSSVTGRVFPKAARTSDTP